MLSASVKRFVLSLQKLLRTVGSFAQRAPRFPLQEAAWLLQREGRAHHTPGARFETGPCSGRHSSRRNIVSIALSKSWACRQNKISSALHLFNVGTTSTQVTAAR